MKLNENKKGRISKINRKKYRKVPICCKIAKEAKISNGEMGPLTRAPLIWISYPASLTITLYINGKL